MLSDVSSSSSELSSTWRPASPPKTGFKGKTIVTEAQVHKPEDMTSSNDSGKTEDIADMTFEGRKEHVGSTLEHTLRIEDIDRDTEYSDQRDISQQDSQRNSEIVEPAVTGLTGQERVSLNNEQRATPYENDDEEHNDCSTSTLDSTDDSYNTAKSSLSEGSRPVITDEGEIREEDGESIESTISVSGDSVSTQITAEKLTNSVADTLDQSLEDATITPNMSVEGAQTQTTLETTILNAVECAQIPSTSVIPIPSVEGAQIPSIPDTPVLQPVEGALNPGTSDTEDTLTNVEVVPNLNVGVVTVANVSVSATIPVQQDVAYDLKGKPSCQDCPHKAVTMPTDIEHIADPPPVTRATRVTNLLNQPSIEPRPVPIMSNESLTIPSNKLLVRTIAAEQASLSSVPTEYGSCPTSYATAHESSRSTDDTSSHYDSASGTDYESFTDSTEPTPAPQLAPRDTSKTEIVPVSSSMVDLLCCIQRLTSFACHLCKVLCPTEQVIPGHDGQVDMGENRARTMEIKAALCGKLIKVRLLKRGYTLRPREGRGAGEEKGRKEG